jgi:LPXTG-motif cell wall-anchored protein
MSGTKVTGVIVTGGSTAASLPVTGSPVFAIIVAGVALVATGFLMVRASRFNRSAA